MSSMKKPNGSRNQARQGKEKIGGKGEADASGSPGAVGELSLLLALEPRFMFDAEVAAAAAEVASAAEGAADANDGADVTSRDIGAASFAPAGGEMRQLSGEMIQLLGSGGIGNEQPEMRFDGHAPDANSAWTGNEDSPITLGGLSVADPDVGDTLCVTLTVEHGRLTLAAGDGYELLGKVPSDGVTFTSITIQGEQQYVNEALKTLTYQGDRDWYGADALRVSIIEANPDHARWHDPFTASMDITVLPVNDDPVIGGYDPQKPFEVQEDKPLYFGGNPAGNGDALFSISDPDSANPGSTEKLTVALSVENGTLTRIGGGTVPASFTGTEAEVNAYLKTIVYQGNRDYYGDDHLTVTVTDAEGAAVTERLRIQVSAVDDEPVVHTGSEVGRPDSVVTALEGGTTVLTGHMLTERDAYTAATYAADGLGNYHIVIEDVDSHPSQLMFKLEKAPERGRIEVFKGSTWTILEIGKDQFSFEDLIQGRVRYVHLGDAVNGTQVRDIFPGSTRDDFKFIISYPDPDQPDAAYKTTVVPLAVELKPVNQPPEVSIPAPGSTASRTAGAYDAGAGENVNRHVVYEGEAGAVIIFDIADPDQDPTIGHIVTITGLPTDGDLYYQGTKITGTGVTLDMNVIKAGGLTYTHSGVDGPEVGLPLGAVRPDGFKVAVTDDGGGTGTAADPVTLDVRLTVYPSDDLPYIVDDTSGKHPQTPGTVNYTDKDGAARTADNVMGNINVGGWGDVVIDPYAGSMLAVVDKDSQLKALTYTITTDFKYGDLYYRADTGQKDAQGNAVYTYRELGKGSSFTQADLDARAIVYRYASSLGGPDDGSGNSVHKGTDVLTFEIRDGSKAVVDAEGKVHPEGFEGGIGEWAGGVWSLSKLNIVMNVDFTAGPGPGKPITIITCSDPELVLHADSDKSTLVYEGGVVKLGEADLKAMVAYDRAVSSLDGGGNPVTSSERVYDTSQAISYRIEQVFSNGWLVVIDPSTQAVLARLDLYSTFTQQQIESGQIGYQHNGTESWSDVMKLSISNGTVDYKAPGGGKTIDFGISVKPVNDTPTVGSETPIVVDEGPTPEQIARGESGYEYGKNGVTLTAGNLGIHDRDTGPAGAAEASGVNYSGRSANELTLVFTEKPAYGDIWHSTDGVTWRKVVYADGTNATTDPDWSAAKLTKTDGSTATVISMAQLNSGYVRYIHDGTEQFADQIKVVVNDNTMIYGDAAHDSDPAYDKTHLSAVVDQQTFTPVGGSPENRDKTISGVNGRSLSDVGVIDVVINPINDGPALQNNQTLHAAFGGDTTVGGAYTGTGPDARPAAGSDGTLWFTDDDNSAKQLLYTIQKTVEHGTLYLKTPGGLKALGKDSTFSQQDIIDGNIIYRHDGQEDPAEHHADAFYFTLTDGDAKKALGGNSMATYLAYTIEVRRENLAPTIESGNGSATAFPDQRYYLGDPVNGIDLSAVFKVADRDYKSFGPDGSPGGGVKTDKIEVTLEALDGTTPWGVIEITDPAVKALVQIDPAHNGSAGRMILTGTLEDVNNALAHLRYLARDPAKPGSTDKADIDINRNVSFTIHVDDLGNGDEDGLNPLTADAAVTICVSPYNDSPVFDGGGAHWPVDGGGKPLNNPLTLNEDTSIAVRSGNGSGGPLHITDSDEFGRNINEMTLTVGHGSLSYSTGSGIDYGATKKIDNADGSVTYFLVGTNQALNNVLATLKYIPKADYNGPDAMVLTYKDGHNGLVGTGASIPFTITTTVDITVLPINDPPTVAAPGGAIIVDYSKPYDVNAGGVCITIDDKKDLAPNPLPNGKTAADVDHFVVTVGAHRLDGGSEPLYGILNVTAPGSVSVTGNATSAITLEGTKADINAALATLTYHAPTPTFGGDGLIIAADKTVLVELRVDVNDLANGSAVADTNLAHELHGKGTVSIQINNGNEAPVIAAAGDVGMNEDGKTGPATAAGFVFSGVNGISITDVDSNGASITVVLEVEHGILNIGNKAQVERMLGIVGGSYTGDGSGRITITAVPDIVNKAVDGLVYKPAGDWNGVDRLTITAKDQGFVGANNSGLPSSEQGSPLTTVKTIAITVNPVNDAPTANNSTEVRLAAIDEDSANPPGSSVASLFGGRFSDARDDKAPDGSSPDSFAGVMVVGITSTASSAKGNWEYSVDGSTWVKIPAANNYSDSKALFLDAAVQLRFVPDKDANGEAPKLAVRLVDDSTPAKYNAGDAAYYNPAAPATGMTADIAGKVGGDSRYSNEKVTLGQTITPVDDAPTIAYAGAGGMAASPITVNEDTSLPFSGGNKIAFADVDAGTGQMKTILTVSNNGVLTIGSISGTSVTGNNTASVTLTGTLAQINAAIASLGYKGIANFNGVDTLHVEIQDGGNTGAIRETNLDINPEGTYLRAVKDIFIQVNQVNDAPTFTAKPSTASVNEDATLAFTGTNAIRVDDVEIVRGEAADYLTVTLSLGNAADPNGMLALTLNGTPMSSSGGTLTLAGTKQQINDALATLAYTPGADWNGTQILNISVTDSPASGPNGTVAAQTTTNSVTINVNPVNDAPEVVGTLVSGAKTVGLPAIDEDTPPAAGYVISDIVAGTGVTGGNSFSDLKDTTKSAQNTGGSEANSLKGVMVVGYSVSAPPEGVWQYSSDGGATWTTIATGAHSDANALFLDAAVALRFSPAANYNGPAPELSVRLADNSTPAKYNAADAAYYNPDAPASGTTANIAGKVGGDSRYSADVIHLTQSVNQVNDAPTVGKPNLAIAFNEDTTFAFTGANALSVDDVEIGRGEAADYLTVTLTLGNRTGTGDVNGRLDLVFNGSPTASLNGTVTIAGTKQQINDALATLAYTPGADWNGSQTLHISVTDSPASGPNGTVAARTTTETVALVVNPVNDAPTAVFTGAGAAGETAANPVTLNEEGTVVIPGLHFADIDVGETAGGEMQVVLTAGKGTLSLASDAGLSLCQTSNGGTTLTLRGDLAVINARIAGLTYTGIKDMNGPDAITIVVNDLGNTGSGGPLTASTSICLYLDPVNDPPVVLFNGIEIQGTPPGIHMDEDDTFFFKGSNAISFFDVDVGETVGYTGVPGMKDVVSVSLSVTTGTLSFGGAAPGSVGVVFAPDNKSVVLQGHIHDVNAFMTNLSYSGLDNWHGADRLSIRINDNANTGSGGALQTARDIDITVGPVVDAPEIVYHGPGDRPNNPLVVDEDTPLAIPPALTFLDPDNTFTTTVLDLSVQYGVITLEATVVSALQGRGCVITGNGSGHISLTGDLADANAAARAISYLGNQDYNGRDKLHIQIRDSAQAATECEFADIYIRVDAVNDAPTIAIGGTPANPASVPVVQVNEDESVPLGGMHLISFADVDLVPAFGSDGLPVTVTLSAGHGTLTLASAAGLAGYNGPGGVLTLTGTLADINAAMAGLSYRGGRDYFGPDAVSILIHDKGNVSKDNRDAPLTATARIDIDVLPVDDDPVAVDDFGRIRLTPERGGSVSGNILANDYDPDLTPVAVVNPERLAGKYGTLTVSADGSYVYTADPNNAAVRNLQPGGKLVDAIVYEMRDSNGGAHQFATLTIEITNAHAPEATLPPHAPPTIHPPVPAESGKTPPIGGETTPVSKNSIPPAMPATNVPAPGDPVRDIAGRPWAANNDRHNLVDLPWSELITLVAQPDNRNVYVRYSQELAMPDSMFVHSNPDERLDFEAMLEDGSPLPQWLSFNRNKLTFTCVPPDDAAGAVNVFILARDSHNNCAKAILTIKIRTPEELAEDNGYRNPDQMAEFSEQAEKDALALDEADAADAPLAANDADPDAEDGAEGEQAENSLAEATGNADNASRGLNTEVSRLFESVDAIDASGASAARPEPAERDDLSDHVALAGNGSLWLHSHKLVDAADDR